MMKFNDYRTIAAKFDSTANCGHQVRKGDQIGYAKPRYGEAKVKCAECWRKWQVEVAQDAGDMMAGCY